MTPRHRTVWWDPGGAGAFPVTVERKHGAIEMTAVPQRVVSLGVTDQGCVLALGVATVDVTHNPHG